MVDPAHVSRVGSHSLPSLPVDLLHTNCQLNYHFQTEVSSSILYLASTCSPINGCDSLTTMANPFAGAAHQNLEIDVGKQSH